MRPSVSLEVSQPDDPLEREAEAVADAVIARSPLPGVSSGAATISRCAGNPGCDCGHEDTAHPGQELEREAAAPTGGAALESATKARMETSFGTSFGGVRVHADSRAARLSRSVSAEAFTVGSDIYFGAGRYRPGTTEGDHLIAHELTHTLQQGSAPVSRRTSIHRTHRHVQRFGDLTQVPPGLACPLPLDTPRGDIVHLTFPNNVFALTTTDRAALDSFIVSWRALGGTEPVRVDGFASARGPDPLNWTLSCDRAQVVEAELLTPTSGIPGIPRALLSVFAHGETAEFGAEADNRRVLVSVTSGRPLPTPPPTPPPPTPPVPPTPPACTPANTWYAPSRASCAAYSSPLARRYLTDTYRHNAGCACENTPDDPKNNCVRKCLQDKMAALLAALAAAGPPPPRGPFDAFFPEPHCDAIYRHHVDCYRDCCCGTPFIDEYAFLAMCELPFPCAFVEGSIAVFNDCT